MTSRAQVVVKRGRPGGAVWVNRAGWGVVVGAVAGVMWVWLWPEWWMGHAWGRGLYWIAFAARTLSWHVGLGLIGLGAVMVVARAWRPGGVMAGIGVAVMLASGGWSMARGGARGGAGPALTVMSTNLMVGRAEPALLMSEVERFGPDVILVQEFTSGARAWMDGALGAYPHRVLESREHPFGMAVYSKLPIESAEVYGFGGGGAADRVGGEGFWSERVPQIRVVVRLEGREVVIQNVHTWPPVSPGALAAQVEQVGELAAWAKEEARPVIVAGDFNATPMARSGRWLEAAGLADGHAAAGSGRGVTWPAYGRKGWLPGVRIDQVFTGGGAVCEWTAVGERVGSDHRPIVAKVGLGPG